MNLRTRFRQISQYPSAVAGMIIIGLIIFMAIYAMVTIPFEEAIRLWRGGESVWYDYPKNAAPVWTNWFTSEKLPATIAITEGDAGVETRTEVVSEEINEIITELTFEYTADTYPRELTVFVNAEFVEKGPNVSFTWVKPDGEEVRLGNITSARRTSYRFDQDDRLVRRLGGVAPRKALFADPASPDPNNPEILKGTYKLIASSLVFEEDSVVSIEFVSYGEVHGLAGTDHLRRDLTVALLWGTPIALAFGLIAAAGTTVITLAIAAVGAWYGGWVDGLIQRITEVNLVLPVLPILIMVGTFYSRSIWLMLGIIVLLSIFSGAIKTNRALFLQVKESMYIEAARSYGASNWRIVFRYLLPRVIPIIIPGLVSSTPAFVFLEASLAVLGLGDPVLPTWGKIINDANSNGALFNGYYYWILEPAALLMFIGFGFAMLGFALDRVFNPRLRSV